ncbi:hypothetical protein [uncultured Ruminococcus sp.]|uniref:hypothetical protein n=1 Tax=uncultured Ruminococcus sp. TaxID=165186 RepID=UPI00260FAC45|nr:hypothetical protein [uncultured Ruminococcus sp.]
MFKKILSALLSAVTVAGFIPQIPANAEETVPYPYTLFAGSDEEGAITINSNNICINGSLATNGTISSSAQNFNINGTRKENAQEEMKLFFSKIDSRYFTSHVDTYFEDYFLEDTNININMPIEAEGDIGLTGNINITSGIKALNDVILSGNVENSQDSVICAETGNITINTDNVNLNGLVYAPYGCVNITAQNLNINSVIIIADTITITCPNLNANYNSQMAEFLGNESEPINNDDIEIVAYGEYDYETDVFSVYWNTTVPDGSFDIQVSDDGENYISIGTVTNADSFEYSFTEPFEKKYIKVIETTNNGTVFESVPFIVISTENGYDTKVLDSDEDGLPDIYELKIGTDPYDTDTDDDGLTDYQEYVFTQTDPLVYDSVTEGISDADADTDEDGLSNIDEFTRRTYPWTPDTDLDGPSDYDEIYVYGTDPLVADSDEDGIDDGSEIKLGLDPNDPATNGVPDGEYAVQQTISADNNILASVNTAESPYVLSIDIKTNGDAEEELTVDESGYSAAIENDAMIGASVNIDITDTCNPEEIVLKYEIRDEYVNNEPSVYSGNEQFQGIKRFAVFKYFEDVKALLPLYTEYDEITNTISVNVEDGGTYCIMDTEKWFSGLGVNLSETYEETESPQVFRQNAPIALAPENTVQSTSSNQQKGKGAYGYLFENTPVDLFFMIQNSGSNNEWQKENFEFEKQLIHDISAYAFNKYHDVWIHIIPYGFTTGDSVELNDGWPIETDIADVDKVLSKVEYLSYGSSAYRNIGYLQTVKNLRQSYRENSKKYVINLINGTTNFTSIQYNGVYFQQDCEWVYYYFWANDMVFSEIVYNGNNFDPYLHEYINGNPIGIDLDKTTMIKHIVDNIGVDLTLDTTSKSNYNDVIENINKQISRKSLYGAYSPIDWKPIVLSGELNSENGIDTDGDCLTDWEETDTSKLKMYDDGSFDLPTIHDYINWINYKSYRESIINFINQKLANINYVFPEEAPFSPSNGLTMADYIYNLRVIAITTDPSNIDTDEDGYTDLDDPDGVLPPKYLNGKYDLFDGEIYSLLMGNNCFELIENDNSNNTSIIRTSLCDGSNKQRFRFIWHDSQNGYTIHPISNENMVLSFIPSSHEVRITTYINTKIDLNQLWEIIPCSTSSKVIIKTKYVEINGFSSMSFYLSCDDSSQKLICSSYKKDEFIISNPEYQWKRYGEIYCQALIDEANGNNSDELRAIKNCQINYSNINLIYYNIIKERINNKDYNLLINQDGGIFEYAIFAETKMKYVICEALGTYNALKMADIIGDDSTNISFFRLASEFEINAIQTNYSEILSPFAKSILNIWEFSNDGGLGSNPKKIKNCLDVYNANYQIIDSCREPFIGISEEKNSKLCSEYESFITETNSNGLLKAKSGIISFTFDITKIHTYAMRYDPNQLDGNCFKGFNRSDSATTSWDNSTVKNNLTTNMKYKHSYYIGYVLY